MRSFLIEQTLFQSKSRCVLYVPQCNSRITIEPFANKGGYLNACLHLTRSINIEYIVKTVNKKKKRNKEREQKAMRSSLSKSNCRKAKKRGSSDGLGGTKPNPLGKGYSSCQLPPQWLPNWIINGNSIVIFWLHFLFGSAPWLHSSRVSNFFSSFLSLIYTSSPKNKKRNTNGNRYFIELFLYIQSFWGGKATLNVNKCRHPPIWSIPRNNVLYEDVGQGGNKRKESVKTCEPAHSV